MVKVMYMLSTALLVSALIYTFILSYNVIMTIIYCNKMEKANNEKEYFKYNELSDKSGSNVKPALYASSFFWLVLFIVGWLS